MTHTHCIKKTARIERQKCPLGGRTDRRGENQRGQPYFYFFQ